LLINVVIQPFAIWLGASLALVHLRSPKALMVWTRPGEVQDHPLLVKTDRAVHYLGGLRYPLPWKFSLLQGAFAPALVLGLTLNQPLTHAGLSLGMRLAAQTLAIVLFLIPLLTYFRRIQPRWLNWHLATLPADAKPPANEEAASANAIP
jgi:hypothetical protein